MDGLIKDLVGVALGRDNNDEESNPEILDERSRSTWAEVVSGDQENDEERGDHRHGYNRNRWSRKEQSRPEQEEWGTESSRISSNPHKEQYRTEQEWEQESSRFSNRPPKEKYRPDRDEWEAESERISNRPQKLDGDNDDGWETVGKKPQRQQHKVPKDHWNDYKLPSSEQQYSNEVGIGVSVEASDDELADLSQACNKLWDLDLNRLVPGKDYDIDTGEGKKAYQKEDMAQGSLFNWVSDDVFRKPTFSRFCSLLDNYNPHQGSKEVVTFEEKQEQAAFIEEISRTAPIKYLHKYLATKGIASGSYQDFKRMMTSLWFDLYSRGGICGSSSAFEHVFVGEIKQSGEVSGFHNWLQFYLEEAKGRVDYQGYIFPRRRGEIPDSETQLLTIQFEWNGVLKSVSSTLVGVSPEFEMALYTLCFFVGGEDNYVQLGPYSVNIKRYRQGDRIGSVFPIADC